MLKKIIKIKSYIISIFSLFQSNLKIWYLRKSGCNIGDRVFLGPNSKIGGVITIGSNTTIVSEARMSGEIIIGKNVIIASGCQILTNNHDIFNANALPYGTKYNHKKVIIYDNCWIGTKVTILPGVVIGEGSVIGAGSIVTKNVDELSIAAGNPAKRIGERNSEQYNFLKEKQYFLNDIRGKKYLNKLQLIKYKRIIKNKINENGLVYDFEFGIEPKKIRKLLYDLSKQQNKEVVFQMDEKGFFISKNKKE